MTPAKGCVDAATMHRLAAGKLPPAEADAVLAHLESCDDCVRTAGSLPEPVLTAWMRSARRQPALDARTAREYSLIGRVLKLRSEEKANHAEPDQPPAAIPIAAPMFGRYRIVRELARGGPGTVYLAEDAQLHRKVAIQVPTFGGPPDRQAEQRQRFLRDARAAAAINHPNVCKVLHFGEQDGSPYLVTDYIEGASLADRLPPRGRLKERAAVAFALRIANALRAIHEQGTVHRDLSPANILLKKDRTPVLTDFGLVRVPTSSERPTAKADGPGTPAYLAPEQLVPDLSPVTPRSDVYGLGAVLFRMVTGGPPVEGTPIEIVKHYARGKPATPALSAYRQLNRSLAVILDRALRYRPEDRYADANEFAAALRDWLHGSGTAVPAEGDESLTTNTPARDEPDLGDLEDFAETTPALSFAPPRKRRRWLPVLAAAAVVFGGMAVALRVGGNGRLYRSTSDNGSSTAKAGGTGVGPSRSGDYVNEDFHTLVDAKKAIPDDWEGESFGVSRGADRRAYLYVTEKSGPHYVTLPHTFTLGNRFLIDVRFALSHAYGQLHVVAESRKAGKSIHLVVEGTGNAYFADKANRRGRWLAGENRVQLERIDRNVYAKMNGDESPTLSMQLPDTDIVYDSVRIGFVAGHGEDRLYAVKVAPVPAP